MKKIKFLAIIAGVLIASLAMGGTAFAECNLVNGVITCDGSAPIEAAIGSPLNDTILIEQFGVTVHIEGREGDDTITIDGIVQGYVDGDSVAGVDGGDDTITNNGLVNGGIWGDCLFSPNTGGDDTIINNGIANGELFGDGCAAANGGDDYIENNGETFGIQGDSLSPGGGLGGDDIIINNGDAFGWLCGDGSGAPFTHTGGDDYIENNGFTYEIRGDCFAAIGGDDTIINNGIVDGTIFGEGGDDYIENNGMNYGIIGGSGNDTIVQSATGETWGPIAPWTGDDFLDINGFVAGNIGGWTGDDIIAIHRGAEIWGVFSGGPGAFSAPYDGGELDALVGSTPNAGADGVFDPVYAGSCADYDGGLLSVDVSGVIELLCTGNQIDTLVDPATGLAYNIANTFEDFWYWK